jgi:hypothetical protein
MRYVITVAGCALTLAAAHPGRAQVAVRVRDLPAATRVSSETFGAILGVRELPGGAVLVSDPRRRQLIMLDSTLRSTSVVLDSIAGTANSYGPIGVALIAYPGDSTLFVDLTGQALLMIGPAGKVERVLAVPNARDLFGIGVSQSAVDNKGRLIYRGNGLVPPPANTPAPPGQTRATGARSSQADSAPLLRADFQARIVDTVGALKNLAARRSETTIDDKGQRTITAFINPVPTGDEWAVLSDGTLAIVRGHDYHVDWISADGQARSSPKLPFDWKRLADDDKQHIIDSVRTRDSVARAASAARAANNPPAGGVNAGGGGNGTGGGSGGRGSGMAVAGGSGGAPAGAEMPIAPSKPAIFLTPYVPASELPDYLPPIRSGAARADADGHLWILPATSAQSRAGELVYDVVDPHGDRFERVRIPPGRSIIGFGKDGVVYLLSGDLTKGFTLERSRLSPP